MIRKLLSYAALPLLGISLGLGTALAVSASASVTCPDHTDCITGGLQVQDAYSDEFPRNQLLVSDKSGAPMFWTNVGGSWSGATPFCVTDLKLNPVICLGGPTGESDGQPEVTFYVNGKPVTSLTLRDVQWIHQHGG